MSYFVTDVTPNSIGFGKRLNAHNDRQALSTAARIATRRARTKCRKQTFLVCETVQTPSPNSLAVIRPIAYVTADACGVLLANAPTLDLTAYVAELSRIANLARTANSGVPS